MARNSNSTKRRIVSAAWQLFYEQGYDNTTIDEIVSLACASKGSFYHYFDSKDSLLSSLSFIFDDKYEELKDSLDENATALEKLVYINHELFMMIENSISVDLLARLFSSQLITRSNRNLLDQDRTYYRLLRKIIQEGQQKGELRKDISVNEIVKTYAVFERGLMYDWCLCNGDYGLAQYSSVVLPAVLQIYVVK